MTVPCTGVPATDGAALQAAVLAHSSGDTITLVAGCTYTIANANNLGTIFNTLTVQGNGATINRTTANANFFNVSTGGNLTVNDVTFSGGGSGDGGAIFDTVGHLLVTNSTFTGNQAAIGGAISLENVTGPGATATVIGSTFTGNTASDFGGAIANVDTATVINSTFTGNSSPRGAALFESGGSATFFNSTISGNTTADTGHGALDDDTGPLTVTNTIVSNNTGANCGSVTDGGFNLELGTSCAFSNHNVNADPLLGPLASNGGPTQTMAVTTASPAYDHASLAVCSAATPTGAGGVDQRGLSRAPAGTETACEIGAFEVQLAPATVITPRFTG